jgi:hypothetical protein
MRNEQLLSRCILAMTVLVGSVAAGPVASAQAASGQLTFATPSAAAAALVAACRTGDEDQLLKILGPAGKDLIASGDPVADKKSQQGFVKSYTTKHSLKPEAQGFVTLVIGPSDWPTPIPIVRDGTTWYFDSARGHDEVINRRIGENELGAIAVCEGYVAAQKEYASRGHDGLPSGIYAQKLVSDEGKHNGLYWPQIPGKPMSPMGPSVADASAEGYTPGVREPYHGYYYRLLKEQGPAAEGGAKSYLVDGQLSGGFALLAYPANYGNGGIMTFMVNQDGNILQKDLGDDTEKIAKEMTAYNPDDSWAPAQPDNQ